jgi:energy-coupling factor transporter ATP-binding protein EcfA2
VDYFFVRYGGEMGDAFRKTEVLTHLGRLLSLVTDKVLKDDLLRSACVKFSVGIDLFGPLCKPKKELPQPETWKGGFHGIDEAREIAGRNNQVTLTFNEQTFLENFDSKAIVLAKQPVEKHNYQYLLSKIRNVFVDESDVQALRQLSDNGTESEELEVLKNIFFSGIEIEIEAPIGDNDEKNQWVLMGFVDFYINIYRSVINDIFNKPTETQKAKYIKRCAEIIANADSSVQVVMMKDYAKYLTITQSDLKKLVQPYVNQNKDKATIENQNLNETEDLIEFDAERIPSYVNEDKALQQIYQLDHYYPLLKKTDKGPVPVGYMFQNEKGGGHKCVSDFYMQPLLHIEHTDSALNKRVIQLNHRRFAPRFVEWQSSFMANLGKLNEKFIEVGAYNFDGSMNQYKCIWRNMSYNFTKCTELRTFGQQPEEFWAFTNAILHDVDGALKVEYTNNLGVATHNGKNYYSPAFSEIFAHQRHDDDQYELDRYFTYKKAPENMTMNFEQWADILNKVYYINDNGKWALLFTMLACFRDYIFQHVHRFTTLFFIGPTGSGKSQVAESMRSLFMPPNAPKFNLNNGTDAAFFMLLERNKNVLAIMEEYNDTSISVLKFQGLKAAVLDGQGRQKIKDAASKTMDSSKINAVPLPLGQEAPQQDDGSLSNRVILCDVPYNPNGSFSEEEKERFRLLKQHEETGLCEVLEEILRLRKDIKLHYIGIYNEEIKKIQDTIRIGVTNDEGLGRVIESVAMVTAMCRFVESKTELKLPFTYDAFFAIGCEKVLKQMETISSSNKLQTYFSTISFLLDQEALRINKELKVVQPGKITVLHSGHTETVELEPKEMRVLYLDFESIYTLYHRSTNKEALSRASLRAYFESNKAYLGLCKATKFTWYNQQSVPQKDAEGNVTDKVEYVMDKKDKTTSAYMFNYDVLCDLMNVDFVRKDEPEAVKKDEYIPATKEQDLPF